MSEKRKGISIRFKIVTATAITIFSLSSVFTATYAWFASNNTVSANNSSFRVQTSGDIQFELYYLHHFAVDQNTNKNGNYNYDTNLFAGYELEYSNPVFTQVNFDSNGNVTDVNDPTNISYLWPAHKITYAIVVNGGGLNSFSLDSWSEVRSQDVLTQVNSQDVEISLSWAIDMFGGAYYVTSTASVTDDLSTGFSSYVNDNTLTDKFQYSQTNIAPEIKPSINIVNSVSGTSGDNKRIILYFSIEFSDDSSNYYTYQNPYYVKDALK